MAGRLRPIQGHYPTEMRTRRAADNQSWLSLIHKIFDCTLMVLPCEIPLLAGRTLKEAVNRPLPLGAHLASNGDHARWREYLCYAIIIGAFK